ncbi:MAG TPA: hypothetical protein VGI85_07240 [Chthoniobacterales bacterium]|jgi:hypothetical protein
MSHSEETRTSRWKWLFFDRLTELVFVFIGVYSAFLLNGYQIHQEENQRRGRLLTYLLRQADDNAARLRETTVDYDKRMNVFFDHLAKGEMPPVEPTNWASSYNGNDIGWILQTGALEFFDIQTVARLREVDAIARTGLAILAHDEKLSDALIAPHVGNRGYFYDPVTKKLRPEFSFYLDTWRDGSRFLHTMNDARDTLAKQLRVEQARHR